MFLQSLLFAKDKSYFEKNPRNFVEEFWENRETDATQGYKDLKKKLRRDHCRISKKEL